MDTLIAAIVVLSLTSLGTAAKRHIVQERLSVVESRIDTLERRISLQSTRTQDDVLEIINDFATLNGTMEKLERLCEKGQAPDNTSQAAEPRNIIAGHQIRDTEKRVMKAFIDEKFRFRNTLDKIEERLEKMNQSCATEAENEIPAVVAETEELKVTVANITATLENLKHEAFDYMDKMEEFGRNNARKTDRKIQNVLAKNVKLKHLVENITPTIVEMEENVNEIKQHMHSREHNVELYKDVLTKKVSDISDKTAEELKVLELRLQTSESKQKTAEKGFEKMEAKINAIIQQLQSSENGIEQYKNVITKKVSDISEKTTEELNILERRLQTFESKHRTVEKSCNDMNRNFNRKLEDLKSSIQAGANIKSKIECPSQWKQYEQFCYRTFSNKVSYYSARQTCAQNGAYVVDLQDQTESEFVNSVAGRQNYWIGITYSNTKRAWIWDKNNAPAVFLNWDRGQPRIQHMFSCADVRGRYRATEWESTMCSTRLPFVCKKSL